LKLIRTFLCFLLLPATAAAATLSGSIVKVVDGDTVYVLDAGKEQHKIRLAGIDAPERNQPFGKKSKQRMSGLVAGKEVTVDWYKKDRWGETYRYGLGRDARMPLGAMPEDPGRGSRSYHLGARLALQALRTRAAGGGPRAVLLCRGRGEGPESGFVA
jgi:hypothetical protein